MHRVLDCFMLFVLFILSMALAWPIQNGAQAQDAPGAARPPAAIELQNYVDIASESRKDVKEQLSLMGEVPDDVKQVFSRGVQHLQALVEAAKNGDLAAARRHFQKAMRAFIRVSDFIQTSQNGESEMPETTRTTLVKKLLGRMKRRVSRLRELDSARSLGADFSQIRIWADRAQTAASRNNIGRLRTCLIELKKAIVQVEDYISEQLSLVAND